MTKRNQSSKRRPLTAGQKASRTKGKAGFKAAGIRAAVTRLQNLAEKLNPRSTERRAMQKRIAQRVVELKAVERKLAA